MTQSRFNASFLSLAGARHRGAATLAALSLVLVAGGCGSSGSSGGGGSELTKAQYEQHLQNDSQAITKAFTPLRKPPRTLNELAGELKVGEEKLHEASADLNSVNPPKDVRADNTALAKGLSELAGELELLRKAAAKNDAKLVQQAINGLQQSHALVDARRATDDMKKKGYKLGNLGS